MITPAHSSPYPSLPPATPSTPIIPRGSSNELTRASESSHEPGLDGSKSGSLLKNMDPLHQQRAVATKKKVRFTSTPQQGNKTKIDKESRSEHSDPLRDLSNKIRAAEINRDKTNETLSEALSKLFFAKGQLDAFIEMKTALSPPSLKDADHIRLQVISSGFRINEVPIFRIKEVPTKKWRQFLNGNRYKKEIKALETKLDYTGNTPLTAGKAREIVTNKLSKKQEVYDDLLTKYRIAESNHETARNNLVNLNQLAVNYGKKTIRT